ncbi:helicase HerA-like domain-containing protein [[Clostridium] aminophilum]|uniref:helicase HerA-like domain-containing protein n=1 Tax=[Clostridium] aminophilum TaxID=1526 RepID=UPI00333462E4
MFYENKIWMANDGDEKLCMFPGMLNRHGLIAGATGTGKTITLKVLAESLSDAGVPVFLADVKGDLAGMCEPGENTEDMQKRIASFGLDREGFSFRPYPVQFWDLEGKNGLPLHTTVSEMGPLLLSRLLRLSDLQSDILQILFRIADEQNLLLIDTKDLRAMIQYVADNNAEFSAQYGNMTKQSLNAILRAVVSLESQGGENFFAEPAIDIHDWFRRDSDGRGVINILDARSSIQNPVLYSTFMLYLMSELFEQLPERGDADKPEIVFFFDEAHLLFDHASPLLEEKIGQVVKLIRSRGVGIYFITQNPGDLPDEVLSQLGNRIQHALRAYTPAEKKKIRAAARSFRENPAFDTETVLSELGTGEAVISFLDEKGIPSVAQRAKILPPQSKMGTISESARKYQVSSSDLAEKYGDRFDRDSAYEFLQRKNAILAQAAAEERAQQEASKEAEKQAVKDARDREKENAKKTKRYQSAAGSIAKTAAGTVGRELGNAVGSTVGGKFGKKIGGNVGASLFRGIIGTLFGGR